MDRDKIDKLLRMARQDVSPHERDVARRKLAEVGEWPPKFVAKPPFDPLGADFGGRGASPFGSASPFAADTDWAEVLRRARESARRQDSAYARVAEEELRRREADAKRWEEARARAREGDMKAVNDEFMRSFMEGFQGAMGGRPQPSQPPVRPFDPEWKDDEGRNWWEK